MAAPMIVRRYRHECDGMENLARGRLRPAAYNPRKKLKAGDKEYEKIKNSILEFGYVEPIIVNYDMTVIGGHQRLTVLKDLGYTEVQCVVVHIEDEHKVKALNIALNKITGAWNEQLLADCWWICRAWTSILT